ncbi:MAG: HAMP domain-containing histidine kinase [Candidatus Lokiarchaeota archaeon]|nr:HAMP domain-containing histidine kinase [Candidatus Lokiarchaeota archaeon]
MQDVENVYQDAYLRTKCFKGLFVHDISNLFQIISNSIELLESLLKDQRKNEDVIEYFQMISQQLNRGKKLIRNARNISEVEEYEMILEPVEVFTKLRSAIDNARISYPRKDIAINVVSDYGRITVMANELLSEVFENIIINSINYNKNTTVQVEVIISIVDIYYKHYVKIEFKDNGIGIDDSRKEIIFQESHMKSRNSKGMGIGLSLVAKLIELYAGKICVENRIKEDSTKGSNFIILIPLEKKRKVLFNDRLL